MTVEKVGVDKTKIRIQSRLLSDNGHCYLSKDLKEYLKYGALLPTMET